MEPAAPLLILRKNWRSESLVLMTVNVPENVS